MGHNVPMQVRLGAVVLVGLALVFSPAAQAQTVTIVVTSRTTQLVPHDLPPKNKANSGDSIDFKDLLTNRQPQFGKAKGKPIAYDVGVLRYTSSTKTTMSVTATFPGIGTITFAGDFDANKGNNVLPITGGTGGFKGAKGTVTIGPGATASPNTYRVTVPGHPIDIHGTGGGVA
jgi:hypothetical protein